MAAAQRPLRPAMTVVMVSKPESAWEQYVGWFHEQRAGITEEVLSRSFSEDLGSDPYGWLQAALPSQGRVLDLACGSGPLLGAGSQRRWVGVDKSASEASLAAGRGRSPVARADARALPFPDESFEAVACSMALMVTQHPDALLAEVLRVLVPGGRGVFLVPGSFPLSARDRLRYARALLALGRLAPAYPSRAHLVGLARKLSRAGFHVVADERAYFRYRFKDEHDVRRFLASFYAPESSSEQLDRATRAGRAWVGSTIGVPLRRLACVRGRRGA